MVAVPAVLASLALVGAAQGQAIKAERSATMHEIRAVRAGDDEWRPMSLARHTDLHGCTLICRVDFIHVYADPGSPTVQGAGDGWRSTPSVCSWKGDEAARRRAGGGRFAVSSRSKAGR